MKKILIVGAGDFGREMFCWLTTDERHGVEWEVAGFLDDNPDAMADHSHYGASIVGSISEYSPSEGELLLMAMSAPETKLKLAAELQARGAEFMSWIHPSAVISRFVKIGAGTVICPQCVVSSDATIGDFVTINCTSNIGHDIQIGNGCTINAQCDLTGHTKLGEGVFVGSNVCVVPKVEIGEFASIGAGSVVVRRVKAGTTVMGPAAKRIDLSGPAVSQKDAA